MKTAFRSSRERFFAAIVAIGLAAALCGCGSMHKKIDRGNSRPSSGDGAKQQSLIVASTASGKVERVNQQGRFVVLAFPIGQVPPPQTRMVVYHADGKTGEVTITGPTQDNLTVADIVLGVVQENDEVRSQ